jgi:purine-nucleoside phosphorylase
VIVANHCGMRVLGISCITNMAAGILDRPLRHEEVMEVGEKARDKFVTLLKEIIKEMD